jgi:hypothetical protein
MDVTVHHDALQLSYEWCPPESTRRTCSSQRVSVTCTPCHFGGFRHWFWCDRCGRRAAKLYIGQGAFFACQRCHGLAYFSQSETRVNRAIIKAQRLRVRLGGGPSVFDPPPGKPSRMHWATYRRRLDAVFAAEERALCLQLDWLRTRYTDVTLASHEPEPSTGKRIRNSTDMGPGENTWRSGRLSTRGIRETARE